MTYNPCFSLTLRRLSVCFFWLFFSLSLSLSLSFPFSFPRNSLYNLNLPYHDKNLQSRICSWRWNTKFFGAQTIHQILARRLDLVVIIQQKRNFNITDFVELVYLERNSNTEITLNQKKNQNYPDHSTIRSTRILRRVLDTRADLLSNFSEIPSFTWEKLAWCKLIIMINIVLGVLF